MVSPGSTRYSSVLGMNPQVGAPETAEPSSPSSSGQAADFPFRASVWAMIVILMVRSPANLVVLGWFTETYRDTEAASEVSHRLHEVAFGVFFTLALVGAISQLLNARRHLAGLAQLTITLATLAIVVTSTLGIDYWLFLYLIPLVGILWFHGSFRPVREGPIQMWALLLLVIAFPAFVGDIAGNASRAMDGAQNHTTHWSVMAAFYVVLLLLGAVVMIRIRGYKLVGWSLGLASIVFGSAAVAFPYDASSHRIEFAVFLIVWGVAWALGTALSKARRETSNRRRVLKVVGYGLAIPLMLLMSGIVVFIDTPPNVPHRPNPDIPQMTAADVERGTCLGCHASGTGGAPKVPHETTRTCGGEEPCWGGRSDCAGCHRIDPALGGPTDQEFLSLAVPVVRLSSEARSNEEALSASELRTLDARGEDR